MKLSTSMLAVAFLIAGCGGQGAHVSTSTSPQASSSPTTSPVAPASASPAGSPATSPAASPVSSPVPLTGTFAVLATPAVADNYTVTIVGVDGKVAGSAQASSPTTRTCGDGSPALVPQPISTSDDRAYYMDALGVVRFLTVHGETGRATTVPTGSARRSMFAVSPDDQRIAVVVDDYTSNGVSLRLYVEDLNGATNHVDIFTSSGAYGLWPIGWHGTNNLVLSKVAACAPGGSCGPGSCSQLELHVVDPATAVRRFTIGGGNQCILSGPPSPAGLACENPAFTQGLVLSWTDTVSSTFAVQGPVFTALSPDGSKVAVVDNTSTRITGVNRSLNLLACGWIDSSHVISGGDVQQQPRIGNVSSGAIVPIAVQGICAGRLPGGL